MNRSLYTKLSLLFLTVVFLTGCSGLLSTLRSASNSASPFIDSLVAQNVITRAKADAAKGDVDAIIDGIAACDAELKAITATGPARKVAKARAYKNLAVTVRTVLQRRNIGGNPQLDRISAIFDGAALALEIYFNSVTGSAAGPESGVASDADKALEDAMKKFESEMKAATKK